MTSEAKRASLPASPFSDEPRQKRETPRLQPLATNKHRASQPMETTMTKQLTPLRRKDQATGYAQAVKEIVEWLKADNGENYYECNLIATDIEAKFGGDNGQRNED